MMNVSALLWTLILAGVSSLAEETGTTRVLTEDRDRVPIQTVVPMYPEKAQRDRIEGEVQVCYEIDRKGRPYRVAVRRSTHRLFERPSIRAVKASAYAPLKPGEKASGIKTCRTFKFQLEPIAADNLAA